MYKAIVCFILITSLSLIAMENAENKTEIDDDEYTHLETEQQKFQVKLWLLKNQNISLERIKLHATISNAIKKWAHQEINSKKQRNAEQYMTIAAFDQSKETLYKKVRCMFERKQWNDQTEQFERSGTYETRYLVKELSKSTVYKKRLQKTELPCCVQHAIKDGRSKAIKSGKFFYADLVVSNSNNKIKVYANKDMLDIYGEELNTIYDFDLKLSRDRYSAMNYISTFFQGLPEDIQRYDEFVTVVADEQEESYVCKKGERYYLFGVWFNQDVPPIKDGVYSIKINDTLYKFADKLVDIDQKIIDKMNQKSFFENSSSEEISSESSDQEDENYKEDLGGAEI